MTEYPQTDPAPEEHSPDESKPKKKFSTSSYLWGVVILILVTNVSLIVFSSAESTSPDELFQSIQDDREAFDRLSFWQKFLKQQDSQARQDAKLSLLDGQPIDPEYEESVVSVMIDNFVTARPQQSGIRSASVVYEALAEGGITRLMLIFPYQEISRVGPVRSARDYFVDFAEEYGGIYVHAGGSPLALEKLYASANLHDLDEDDRLEGETYSKRDLKYRAPHNLFFDLLLVRERAAQLKWDLSPVKAAKCFSEDPWSGNLVGKIHLNFARDVTSDSYVQYSYDPEQKTYKRFYGATNPIPHTDQYDALQVSPQNLIVQIAPSQLINGDEKERLAFHHIGSGAAFFYQRGRTKKGTWEKKTSQSPTNYFDELGQPICFSPGQTWIALIDSKDLLREE